MPTSPLIRRVIAGAIASACAFTGLVIAEPAAASSSAVNPAVNPASTSARNPSKIAKAPWLPTLPSVTASAKRDAKGAITGAGQAVAVGAAINSGIWTVFGSMGGDAAKSNLKLPAVNGVPLMGDWNGDGLMTPGYFAGGAWFTSDDLISLSHWNPKTNFGASGDTPVVGQIDKDGKADIGTFNAGHWNWQLSGEAAGKQDDFGQAGDIPAPADWNGDGRTELAVVRAGTWMIRLTDTDKKPEWAGKAVTFTPEGKGGILSFPFGDPAGIPVPGDWNGDGLAEPAVAVGTTWTIANKGLKKLKKTVPMNVALTTGQVPLVGNRAVPIGHCPTTTPGVEKSQAALAKTVNPAAKLRGNSRMPGAAEILGTVQDGIRYAMVNDLTKRLRWRVREPYYDALSISKTLESSIRRSANEAQAAAIMLTTSNWTTVNGISRAQLLAWARWQIRSIACTHRSTTTNGWGDGWQTALWASTAGQAGWLLWPQLTPQERGYVASMVASEADYVVARGPRYFRDRAGKESTPGDSKADEVSWDAVAPALALAMLPKDPRATSWLQGLTALSIAAFARPSDLTGTEVINGVNLAKSLPGTNANEDGTITNHGIVNPDYTQNVLHLWWGASMLRQGNEAAPSAMFLNTDIIYRALAVVQFPSPPYAAPGGSSYKPGGQIYYPQKVSWGARRPATFCGVDSFAAIYTPPDTNAKTFLFDHAADTRALQKRFTDGHIYLPGNAEEGYALGKEEYALSQMALAWWAGAVPSGPKLKVISKPIPGVDLNPHQ